MSGLEDVIDAQLGGMVAMRPQQVVRPAFTVQRLEGEVDHEIHAFDKKTNKILSKTVKEPAGFLVTFAKGHSIRCRDEAHLNQVRAGMDLVPLVNTETGEVVGHTRRAA